MQLTERHIIDRSDPRFVVIDQAAFASKNLYNAALYLVRQSYIFEGKYLNYNEVQRRMPAHEAYKALPAKVSQQVLKQLDHDWDAFFKARQAYNEDPSKFKARPKIPGYKYKTKGRNLLVYTIQAISKRGLKRGLIQPSMLPIEIKTHHTEINQVRIVPRKGFYVLEVIYEHEQPKSAVEPAYYAGIDIGIDNLAALTSNLPGFVPVLVNGRPVKSVNQF